MKIRKAISLILLLFGLGVMTFAGRYLLDARQSHMESTLVYDTLRAKAKNDASAVLFAPSGAEKMSFGSSQIYIPNIDIDFETLKTVNGDTVGWLYSPNTAIDYPLMRADDYDYYLSHLPDGTVNPGGSLFTDYHGASDFSDRLTVIYGHHMKSGSMFGSLKGYKEQDYYNSHPFVYLYTENSNYRIDLLYGFVIGAEEWRSQAFMLADNIEALVAYAKHNTTFESAAKHSVADRLVAMSTCSYEYDGARYVVVGVLRPGSL